MGFFYQNAFPINNWINVFLKFDKQYLQGMDSSPYLSSRVNTRQPWSLKRKIRPLRSNKWRQTVSTTCLQSSIRARRNDQGKTGLFGTEWYYFNSKCRETNMDTLTFWRKPKKSKIEDFQNCLPPRNIKSTFVHRAHLLLQKQIS